MISYYVKYFILTLMVCSIADINFLSAQIENDHSVNVFHKVSVNNGKPTIKLKWVYDGLKRKDGWEIYRKKLNESQNWIKISPEPITFGNQSFLEILKADSSFSNYLDLIPKDFKKPNSTLGVFLLRNIIENETFAQYYGVRFDDQNAEPGEEYLYKVEATNDDEIHGISDTVDCCLQSKISITDPTIYYHNSEEVALKWKPEPEKYFGTNCYRVEKGAKDTVKLNDHPIVVLKTFDKNEIYRYPDYFFKDTTIESNKEYDYLIRPIDIFGQEGHHAAYLNVENGKIIDVKPPQTINFYLEDKTVSFNWEKRNNLESHQIVIERSRKPQKGFVEIATVPGDKSNFKDIVDEYGSYYYKFYIDGHKSGSDINVKKQVYVIDEIPPQSPKNLNVNVDGSQIHLSWEAVDDNNLLGYRAFLSHNTNPDEDHFSPLTDTMIKTTKYHFEIDSSMEADYILAVAAYDSFHNQSVFSKSEILKFEDVTPPEAPRLIRVKQIKDSISIDWLESHHIDVSHYRVKRKLSHQDEFKTIHTTQSHSKMSHWSESIPLRDTDISYCVQAVDDNGLKSDNSNIVRINIQGEEDFDLQLPHRSEIKLNYMKYDHSVKVRWNDKSLEDIRGYIVFRAEAEGNLIPVSGLIKDTKFIDNNISSGNQYSYEIRFYTLDNQSGAFDKSIITIPKS